MPTLKMENILGDFDELKISALSKSKQINAYVKNTTIGPNRSIIEDEEVTTCSDTDSALANYTHTSKYDNTNSLMINKLRAEMENQRQGKVQEAMDLHVNRILEFSKNQSLNSNQQLQRKKQVLLNEKQQQELMILQALEQHDKDASAKQQQLIRYYGELAERRKKIDQELQEREKRRQLITAIIERIKKDQVEFRIVYQEIINTYKNCKFQSQLKPVLGDILKQMKALPDSMDDIVNRCKAGKVSENECRRSNELVQEIKGVLGVLQQKIAAISAEQQQQAKPEPKAEPAPLQPQLPQPYQTLNIPVPQVESAARRAEVPSTQIDRFVSISSLRTYSELQDYLDNYTKTFEELLQNDAFKQFRFNCKKAVNIPVNAISAVSSHHLLDKYNRLSNLLSGKTVEVGGSQICAAKHPQGLAFCTNLLAKKFVLQGDLMISSNPEAAFCYAAIIVALWNEYPNFGKLVLAHFHKQSPYVVPLYPPRAVGQSDEEFYRSQGYQYTDGVVEKQDKFLKRMTGIMRLYAAIIIAVPKRGQQQNPHGLTDGWRWLAAFLNLEPKPDITATILHVFFEIAGSTLQVAYGKAFQRVMIYVCRVYLPMIQKIDSGGPVTRLEVLLQEYMKTGRFEAPHGMEIEVILTERVPGTTSSLSIYSTVSTTDEYLHTYTKSQAFIHNFAASYEELLRDEASKAIERKCIMAVNLLIKQETVWSQLCTEVIYQKLTNLLTGKFVVIKDLQIAPIKSPLVLNFCVNLVAEKFITFHLRTSSNLQTAFCHGAVITALWNEISHFGKLVMAHFYKQCPYLVPLHLEFTNCDKTCSQNMAGLMRLYAAITVVEPTIGNRYYPCRLEHAWHWLASFLNIKPELKPNISAELLLAFLSIASSKLQTTYGKNFDKIVSYIRHSYVPLLSEVEVEEPVVKLVRFLKGD